MLGLQLREEFLGPHMPGTAIALRTNDNKGAAQKAPDQILSITYLRLFLQSEKVRRKPYAGRGDF